MDNVRTVSDTKRDFYTFHTRPISSVYRRVIEELLVELHLLSVNLDFHPDPIYYLGVVTTFDRFMAGYRPEADQESLFSALCRSIGGDPDVYRQQAEKLANFVNALSMNDLLAWLKSPTVQDGAEGLAEPIQAIADRENFKYSRVFATGLYTMLAATDLQALEKEEKREKILNELAEALHLPAEKMRKDIDLYRANLEKMEQLLKVLDEMLESDRKKNEERAKAKAETKSAEAEQTNEQAETTPASESGTEKENKESVS